MRFQSLAFSTVVATALLAGGCAHERHAAVPPTATLGAEGEKRLAYTTNGPGTLYVYDQTKDRLVYSGDVTGERQITVDPETEADAVVALQRMLDLPGKSHRD